MEPRQDSTATYDNLSHLLEQVAHQREEEELVHEITTAHNNYHNTIHNNNNNHEAEALRQRQEQHTPVFGNPSFQSLSSPSNGLFQGSSPPSSAQRHGSHPPNPNTGCRELQRFQELLATPPRASQQLIYTQSSSFAPVGSMNNTTLSQQQQQKQQQQQGSPLMVGMTTAASRGSPISPPPNLRHPLVPTNSINTNRGAATAGSPQQRQQQQQQQGGRAASPPFATNNNNNTGTAAMNAVDSDAAAELPWELLLAGSGSSGGGGGMTGAGGGGGARGAMSGFVPIRPTTTAANNNNNNSVPTFHYNNKGGAAVGFAVPPPLPMRTNANGAPANVTPVGGGFNNNNSGSATTPATAPRNLASYHHKDNMSHHAQHPAYQNPNAQMFGSTSPTQLPSSQHNHQQQHHGGGGNSRSTSTPAATTNIASVSRGSTPIHGYRPPSLPSSNPPHMSTTNMNSAVVDLFSIGNESSSSRYPPSAMPGGMFADPLALFGGGTATAVATNGTNNNSGSLIAGSVVEAAKDQAGCRMLQRFLCECFVEKQQQQQQQQQQQNNKSNLSPLSGGESAAGRALSPMTAQTSMAVVEVSPAYQSYLKQMLDELVAGGQPLPTTTKTTTAFPELMSDPYGNFFIQRLFELGDDETRQLILNSVAPYIGSVANTPHGTFAVQKLVESIAARVRLIQQNQAQDSPQGIAAAREMDLLCTSLTPEVATLCCDPNGGHVVLKVLQAFQFVHRADFLFTGLMQSFPMVANHKQGCCVVQKALDYANAEQAMWLQDVILEHLLALIVNPFGNYVVSHWVDVAATNAVPSHGGDGGAHKVAAHSPVEASPNIAEGLLQNLDDKNVVVAADTTSTQKKVRGVDAAAYRLAPVLFSHCFNKYSSNVVEKILRHCDGDARATLCNALLHNFSNNNNNNNSESTTTLQQQGKSPSSSVPDAEQQNILSLATHAFGNYVLQTALSVAPRDTFERLYAVLLSIAPLLAQHNIGRKVLLRAEAVATGDPTGSAASGGGGRTPARQPQQSSLFDYGASLDSPYTRDKTKNNNNNSHLLLPQHSGNSPLGYAPHNNSSAAAQHGVGAVLMTPPHGGSNTRRRNNNNNNNGHSNSTTPTGAMAVVGQFDAGTVSGGWSVTAAAASTGTATGVAPVGGSSEKPSGCYWPLSPPHLHNNNNSGHHPSHHPPQQPMLNLGGGGGSADRSESASLVSDAMLRGGVTPPRFQQQQQQRGAMIGAHPATAPRRTTHLHDGTVHPTDVESSGGASLFPSTIWGDDESYEEEGLYSQQQQQQHAPHKSNNFASSSWSTPSRKPQQQHSIDVEQQQEKDSSYSASSFVVTSSQSGGGGGGTSPSSQGLNPQSAAWSPSQPYRQWTLNRNGNGSDVTPPPVVQLHK